jgi:hypothetical protein
MSGPISKSGEKFAKEEAEKPHTTVGVAGALPEGNQPAEATVSVTSEHDGDKVSWSVTGWFKRKFMRGGSSAGVSGEIKF